MKKIWVLTLILGLIWACKKGNDMIEEEDIFAGFVQPSNFRNLLMTFLEIQ